MYYLKLIQWKSELPVSSSTPSFEGTNKLWKLVRNLRLLIRRASELRSKNITYNIVEKKYIQEKTKFTEYLQYTSIQSIKKNYVDRIVIDNVNN